MTTLSRDLGTPLSVAGHELDVTTEPADSADPTLIAHRGCPLRGPENSLAAFERAAPHADLIEIDVRRCGSGELVVFHDDTLDRLLGVEGRVEGTPLSELRSHTILDSTETVPTLTETLATIPDDVGVNVELKGDGVATETAEVCDRFDNETLISSFSADVLREFGAVSDAPRAYITMDDDWERALATATDLGCSTLHPQYELVTAERVAAAHERGLTVNVWTIRQRVP
ncbi:MAG: glycerophosphodiester phosphodiesterase, partial [Halobaculum sp.]